jgi:Iap family predicted aminopeptidase
LSPRDDFAMVRRPFFVGESTARMIDAISLTYSCGADAVADVVVICKSRSPVGLQVLIALLPVSTGTASKIQ